MAHHPEHLRVALQFQFQQESASVHLTALASLLILVSPKTWFAVVLISSGRKMIHAILARLYENKAKRWAAHGLRLALELPTEFTASRNATRANADRHAP